MIVAVAAVMAPAVTGTEVQLKQGNQVGTGLEEEVHVEAYNQFNLIRFHVIANSDSDRDQAMKRRIRDLIVRQMRPEFKEAASLEEARRIAGANLDSIKAVAQKEVNASGEDYPVSVQLGKFDFPIKNYGKLTLPAGNYEAVRVVIGRGQGANWWCVLFPPLCFVDVSRTMSPSDLVTTAAVVYAEEEKVKVRFKILEIFDWSFD